MALKLPGRVKVGGKVWKVEADHRTADQAGAKGLYQHMLLRIVI